MPKFAIQFIFRQKRKPKDKLPTFFAQPEGKEGQAGD